MSNKGFMIILGGSVCAVIVYLSSIVQLLKRPSPCLNSNAGTMKKQWLTETRTQSTK